MITKATSPGYLYSVTTDSTCIITDQDTRYNLCKALANHQGMFVAIGGVVECSDDNVVLTQASAVSGGARFEVVTTRPTVGETGVIYLVPAANSTTENLYEEWVWIDDKWEQIGSAGLNLSNYAQLTTANTFSNSNTFNGNLIKKKSTTALADNSVLNRAEMDNRYGKLSGGNSWNSNQIVYGDIHMVGNNITHVNRCEANSISLSGGATVMGTLTTSDIRTSGNNLTIKTPTGYTEFIHDVNIRSSVSIVGNLGVAGTLTAGSERDTIDVHANLHMQGKNIKEVSNISSPNGVSLGVKSSIHAYGNNIYEVDELKLARLGASSLSSTRGKIDVEGSLHFPLGNGSYVDPDIVIANAELRAIDLSMLLGPDKYGIRVTNTSCQLFGIDFNYGDVWSETNDTLKAQDLTPMPGLDSASYFDTVKIRKPAVSIETTGIGSLSFDYANEAYIRTFPNDGGQGIFEFQAGNWTRDDHKFIKRGPVDLRKASATTLGPTSVLNMEEGDARWGGGSGDVLVVSKVPDGTTPLQQTQFASNSAYDSDISFGIAIGPGNTANLYRDIVIGCCLDASPGHGNNTLLGYGFTTAANATGAVAIGRSDSIHKIQMNSIVIGNKLIAKGRNAIAIGGDVTGDSGIAVRGSADLNAVAISGTAKEHATSIGGSSSAGKYGTALGWYSVAGPNALVLQAGNNPAFSMQVYGGEDWESRDTTGYLRLTVAKYDSDINSTSTENREVLTIHKKPLWDAIQRAKDYNYPAQPFKRLLVDAGEVPSELANTQPNTIYHLIAEGMDIDLSSMAFDDTIPGIASAELHIEIIIGNNPNIIWPDIIAWPDEADPSVAPTLTGSDTANKLYAIVVRKQVTTAGEFLVASMAYSFEC